MIRILFVCVHNSSRSQMAEAFVNAAGTPGVRAESAGLEAGTLNPLVVKSMGEIGIDISGHGTRTTAAVLASGSEFDYVITVCDAARAEVCPAFPGRGKRFHWSFPDPAGFTGPEEEVLGRIREVREAIRRAVEGLLADITARRPT